MVQVDLRHQQATITHYYTMTKRQLNNWQIINDLKYEISTKQSRARVYCQFLIKFIPNKLKITSTIYTVLFW